MANVTRITRKTVMSLLNSCLAEAKELTRNDVLGGLMSRVIPADLLPPGLNRSEDERPWLHLTGESYRFYHESLFRLSTDPALEYLKSDELDKHLWHLVCETTGADGSSRTVQGNKKRLDDFIGKLARPILEYEVIIPVDHLDVGERQLQVHTILLRRMQSADLREWGMKSERDIADFNERTFAVSKETGTSPKKVIERARRNIGDDFDVLVAALAALRQIRDEELMFDLAEVSFAKNPSGAFEGSWERSYKPMDLNLGAEGSLALSRMEAGRIRAEILE